MIIFSPANPKMTVTVFTDVDCGYCRKFHSQIAEYNKAGIRVRYMSYPRTGPGTSSWAKSESVWCAADRKDALTRAKRDEAIKSKSCGDALIKAQYELGEDLGVEGTPAIIHRERRLRGRLPGPGAARTNHPGNGKGRGSRGALVTARAARACPRVPSHSLASSGGGFFSVITGHCAESSAFSALNRSWPSGISSSEKIASTGHSGSQSVQSMHSSGSMTSMFGPSWKQSTGQTSTQSMYLHLMQFSVTTKVIQGSAKSRSHRVERARAGARIVPKHGGPASEAQPSSRRRRSMVEK